MSRPSDAPPKSPSSTSAADAAKLIAAAASASASASDNPTNTTTASNSTASGQLADSSRTSPTSVSSFPSISSSAGPPATTLTGSGAVSNLDPALAAKSSDQHPSPSAPNHLVPPVTNNSMSNDPARSHSYPGPIPPQQQQQQQYQQQQQQQPGPAPAGSTITPQKREPSALRGMSLPNAGYGSENSPRSPSSASNKKHKCTYCGTEFTRHHNLKSHLLTHSQEKPYYCQTCSSRFRRLHDLKRHSKLHTGERPHQCLRCGRQFARGDALARHNKGQGGCAGRRTSMGSFVDENDESYDGQERPEDQMEGVQYSGPSENSLGAPNGAPEDGITEDERRRRSLPGIQAPHPPHQPPNGGFSNGKNGPHVETAPMYQATYPRSYPPALGRPSNSLQPPSSSHPTSHPSPTGTGSSTHQTLSPKPPSVSTSSAAVFSQSAMTESPKPLSPGAIPSHQIGSGVERHRSPSYSQHSHHQQQHSHVNRLPPPQNSSGPTLPPLGPPSSAQNSANATLSSFHHSLHPTSSLPTPNPSFPPPTAQGMSGSTAGASSSGSGGGHRRSLSSSEPSGGVAGAVANALPTNNDRLWAVVRSLEDKVYKLTEELEMLKRTGGSTSST